MQHVDDKGSNADSLAVVEKWKGQIEKVVLENLFNIDHLYLVVRLLAYAEVDQNFYAAAYFKYRTCLGHFQAILPWMMMVEMRCGGCLLLMLGIILLLDTVRCLFLTNITILYFSTETW